MPIFFKNIFLTGFERLSLKLNNLEMLDLSDNYFNNSILASLSELSSLKSLYLANNQLTGSNSTEGKVNMVLYMNHVEVNKFCN